MNNNKDEILPLSIEEALDIEISQKHSEGYYFAQRIYLSEVDVLRILISRSEVVVKYGNSIAGAKNIDIPLLERLINNSYVSKTSIAKKFLDIYEEQLNEYSPHEPFCSAVTTRKFEEANLASAFFLKAGGAFAEDMWHDLASSEAIELNYEKDWDYGYRFGPLHNTAIPLSLEAGYWLSPGHCDWFSSNEVFDSDYFIHSLWLLFQDSGDYFEPVFENLDNDFNILEDDVHMSFAVAEGITKQHVIETDLAAIEQIVRKTGVEEENSFMTQSVEITGQPKIEGKRFAELAESDIEMLAENLLIANENLIINGIGVTQHLLSLIAFHPNTPSETVEKIQTIVK